MACCGQSWPYTEHAGGVRAAVFVEHRGGGSLTIHGPMTGIRYHWPGPGVRLPVDPRDAPHLRTVRALAIVPHR